LTFCLSGNNFDRKKKLQMKKTSFYQAIIILCSGIMLTFPGCSQDLWNIDEQGIPAFVNTNFIELDKICCISRFRSTEGHDYSDSFEHCRSMKHYFKPAGDVAWATVKIFSPVAGTIKKVDEEWAGTQLHIESDDYPAFTFVIFHINMAKDYQVGDKVAEGEQLGTHIGSQTMSDIAVRIMETAFKERLISYFDVMSEELFNEYAGRGVTTREQMIISASERDADAVSCDGETFSGSGTLPNWVYLIN